MPLSHDVDGWLICCNPVFEMMNLGDLGEMDVWASLEICCAAMVETQFLQLVQCLDLALCCGKAYLLLSFWILSMSGFVSGVPFILAFLPCQLDKIAGPSYSLIHVGQFKGLAGNILLLKLLPSGRPSPKEKVMPGKN
jgi:hypothetical protein